MKTSVPGILKKGMICNRPHAYIGKLFFFVSLEVQLSPQKIKQLCQG